LISHVRSARKQIQEFKRKNFGIASKLMVIKTFAEAALRLSFFMANVMLMYLQIVYIE